MSIAWASPDIIPTNWLLWQEKRHGVWRDPQTERTWLMTPVREYKPGLPAKVIGWQKHSEIPKDVTSWSNSTNEVSKDVAFSILMAIKEYEAWSEANKVSDR